MLLDLEPHVAYSGINTLKCLEWSLAHVRAVGSDCCCYLAPLMEVYGF